MRLKLLMHDPQTWIICSPEYNGSYTYLLKNTIDWASSPVKGDPVWKDGFESFTGKVMGVVSALPGALGGLHSQSHLVPLLFNSQCWVTPSSFALGNAGTAFDKQGGLVNAGRREQAQAVVDQMLFAAKHLAV